MNWSWLPPGIPASIALEPAGKLGDLAPRSRALASRRRQRGHEGDVERARAAETGAGWRVRPGGERAAHRRAAFAAPPAAARAGWGARAPPRRAARGSLRRSSATSRNPTPPGRTSAWAYSPIAAETTTPPSRAENGGHVGPAAREVEPDRRRRTRTSLTALASPRSRRHPPVVHRRQLAPEIHGHPAHPPVHPLEPPRVIENGHRHRVGEQALRGGRIGRRLEPGHRGEGTEIREARVARSHRARPRRNRASGRTPAPGKRRQLELADRRRRCPRARSRACTICSSGASPLPTVSSSNRSGGPRGHRRRPGRRDTGT